MVNKLIPKRFNECKNHLDRLRNRKVARALTKTLVKDVKIEKTYEKVVEHSNLIDLKYGEQMWRGMRRLTLMMCSEAVMHRLVAKLSQGRNDRMSMKRFADSSVDISICFLKTCSVWVNYLYYPIDFVKTGLVGKKPLTPNRGICVFISNCRFGEHAQLRNDILQKTIKLRYCDSIWYLWKKCKRRSKRKTIRN